ncbi:hypothetical protein BB561_000178 [Smittium simulii]|uniref:Mediator of RNA polymerase II transcription subunit 6 n=1 Tax=Smittium simulii TaxID=133385 RepID=A0A2T9Z059_9FUNG|nr:hypothetical protein BB561_000178 [Smittium simulii]
MNALEVKDLMGIEWRFSEWIFQAGGLNPYNILEYFSLSPFWDPNSNNAVLKMQTQHNTLQNEKIDLNNMLGIEFILAYEKHPEVYIIAKRRRTSPTKAVNISFYYVINGNIYQAPPLTDILSSRMQTSLSEIQEGFLEISSKVNYIPFKGYSWESSEDKKNIKHSDSLNPSITRHRTKGQFSNSIDYMLGLGLRKQSIISHKTKQSNLNFQDSVLDQNITSIINRPDPGSNFLNSNKNKSGNNYTPQLDEQGYSSEVFTNEMPSFLKMPATPTPSLYLSQSNPHTPANLSLKK